MSDLMNTELSKFCDPDMVSLASIGANFKTMISSNSLAERIFNYVEYFIWMSNLLFLRMWHQYVLRSPGPDPHCKQILSNPLNRFWTGLEQAQNSMEQI